MTSTRPSPRRSPGRRSGAHARRIPRPSGRTISWPPAAKVARGGYRRHRARAASATNTVTSRTVNPGPDTGKQRRQRAPRRVRRRGGDRPAAWRTPSSERHHGLFRGANDGHVRHATGGVTVEVVDTRRGVDDGSRASLSEASRSTRRRPTSVPPGVAPAAILHRVRPGGRGGHRRDPGQVDSSSLTRGNARRPCHLPAGAVLTRVPPRPTADVQVTESTSGGFDSHVMDARFDALGAVRSNWPSSFTCPVNAAPNEPRAASPMLTTHRTTAEDSSRALETGPVEHHTPLASSTEFARSRDALAARYLNSRGRRRKVEEGTCNKYCAVVSRLRVRAQRWTQR